MGHQKVEFVTIMENFDNLIIMQFNSKEWFMLPIVNVFVFIGFYHIINQSGKIELI